MPGQLYIVATPIGNLDDITLRALKVLEAVAVIAAEDTRHSQKLLSHFGIHATLTSYHEHNKEQKAEVLVDRLKAGDDIALVSDAGTPGISDPGYYLINRCIEESINIVPIPGAVAAIAGLCVSGLPTNEFVFEGFLPSKQKKRLTKLEQLKDEHRTIVFYEAPHRILTCLGDIREVFGGARRAVLGRELTKIHEEFVRGKIDDIISTMTGRPSIKGEITLVVEGKPEEPPEPTVMSLADHVEKVVREDGISKKDAIAQVAKLRGVPKKQVYSETLGTAESPSTGSG